MTAIAKTDSFLSIYFSPRLRSFFATLAVGLSLLLFPVPEGLDPNAWYMLAIFVSCIAGAVSGALPLAITVMLGMVVAILSGIASFQDLFQSFSGPTVWLICFAFFLAKGLIDSGLAKRAAYLLVSLFGKSTLGLAYGLVFGEAFLAPFIPSIAARTGGIMFPLVSALADEYDDGKEEGPGRRTARFLLLAVFQGSVVSSAMFMTSMAANPLMVQLAAEVGIHLSWGGWALATVVPGIVGLLVAPLVVYWCAPPGQTKTPEAPIKARKMLENMGPMQSIEKMILAVFAVVLFLWLMGPSLGINATVAVMCGIVLLCGFELVSWEECLSNKKAWDTLFWLGGFVAMGGTLKTLGLFSWLGTLLKGSLAGCSWPVAFPCICLAYFYSHYLFASSTAHVVGMYFVCLVASVQVGTPGGVAALSLAVISNLFGGLTHYGNACAPLYFSAGYSSLSTWWRVGFFASIVNVLIWATVGLSWWKVVGLW